jgi:hypothetical protein
LGRGEYKQQHSAVARDGDCERYMTGSLLHPVWTDRQPS